MDTYTHVLTNTHTVSADIPPPGLLEHLYLTRTAAVEIPTPCAGT